MKRLVWPQRRAEAIGRDLAPHRHVERHLALRGEAAAADGEADVLAQFDPAALAVGAVAIDGFAGRAEGACEEAGEGEREGEKPFHSASIAWMRP